METIIRIEETDSGFQIITNKQTIQIGIEQGQNCCENYGYFMSEDNLKDFEGATLLSIQEVDTSLKVTDLPYNTEYGDDHCMFINFNTNKGTLQFTAYNEHNGYYGHSAWVKSQQLTLETIL